MLLAFIRIQENHGTGLAEWERSQKTLGIGYTGLMKTFCALTPLLGHLASAWKQENQVGLDRRTIIDSTLLATKEPSSIRDADWLAAARKAYRPRWAIETFFQSAKAARGRYRLNLRGARHRAIHRSRLATVIWAWNLNRYAKISKNRLRQQQRKAAAIRMAA